MAVEEPQVRPDIQLGDDLALAVVGHRAVAGECPDADFGHVTHPHRLQWIGLDDDPGQVLELPESGSHAEVAHGA